MYCLWPPHHYTLGVDVYCLWPLLFVCPTIVLVCTYYYCSVIVGSSSSSLPAITATSYSLSNVLFVATPPLHIGSRRVLFVATTIRVSDNSVSVYLLLL